MKAEWNVTQRVIISSIPALQTIQIGKNLSLKKMFLGL